MVMSIAVCGVVLISVMISEAVQNMKPKQIQAPEQLVELEKKDPKEVEKTIKTMRVEAMVKELEQQVEGELEEDDSNVWSLFDNYVFMGDSRCVGFSYYDFLRDDRVFAAGGNTIRDVLTDIDQLKEIAPATVYLCYGLNDTGIGEWANGEEYAAELRKVFDELKKALPDTTIVASSILPATEAALEDNPVWRKIPEFDKALQTVCKEKGVIYVDNSELVEEYMSTLYDADGVHLAKAFYPLWAKNLYMATVVSEVSEP